MLTSDYAEAWRWQLQAADEVRSGAAESLALLQHLPVFTFGRRVHPEHLLVDRAELRARGASLVESDRGGDVTFHGPGQIVCYPILDLRRRGLGSADYVRLLEQTMISALRHFGITAGTVPSRPGVWVQGDKIGAIGVRVQGGVTTHGFALNVDTDLSWFDAILPCGLADADVTSMRRLGASADIEDVEDALLDEFSYLFECNFEPVYTSHRRQRRLFDNAPPSFVLEEAALHG
ncbi:MAG TPA: lipoyl(octanoyl) transferase LipB [Dehalococcoidia bacterium]|nr:lipoyl(octanoyl) transferase LipB [Dehalococcoidia bacterium]